MLWRSQIGVALAAYQPDESQVKPNTGRTAAQIAAAGAISPNNLPAPPQGAGVFTVVSGVQAVTVRAPYLNDQERHRWLELLPDCEQGIPSSLSTVSGHHQYDSPPDTGSVKRYVSLQTSENDAQIFAHQKNVFAPSESDLHVFNLDFTPEEIAEIGARIAIGEKKTDVVKAMRGYDSRRHRAFATYYDTLYNQLASRGLVARRQDQNVPGETRATDEKR